MTEIREIEDEATFEAWLEQPSQEGSVALACRAAMRAAPVFWMSAAPVSNKFDLTALQVSRSLLISEDDLERLVREQARPGDMVVCLGAGTTSAWANALPARLEQPA